MEIWFNPPVQNILIECINFSSCTTTQNALLPQYNFEAYYTYPPNTICSSLQVSKSWILEHIVLGGYV